MPWMLGLDRKTLRKHPRTACADLIAEPWEAAVLDEGASFEGRWEKPNLVRSRRVVRRWRRGDPEISPPDEPGQRANLATSFPRVDETAETIETVVSFWNGKGEPADLDRCAFSVKELDDLGSEELAQAVERAEAEGRARVVPSQLERREETISSESEPRRAGVRELEKAWPDALSNPATGRPERRSAWDAACERGGPELAIVQGMCPLCEPGHFACFREAWIDATGALGLESFFAAALDAEGDKKIREAAFGKFPRRALKRVKGQRASLSKRYAGVLRKYFRLLPASDSQDAKALAASLFCNAPPALNAVSPEFRDAWLKDLEDLLEREDQAREILVRALGDEPAEEILDHFATLERLRFHLRAAFVADKPLPLTFRA